MFNTAGIVASQESALMLHATELMLIVVVAVFALTFFFVWHYRASNTKARYEPEWEHSVMDELVWWAVPLEVVLILAALAWGSAHALDPYAPLASKNAPLEVDVVALDWKWLFIYPSEGIATVNYLAIPEQTPVAFKLTSDAPMNALWIPALGGMEMAMPGMTNQLNLMASGTGAYQGYSSNFSGEGFAGMHFPVYAMTSEDFDQWVTQAKEATSTLTWAAFGALAQPSVNNPPVFYQLGDPNLYTEIIDQFMKPQP